PDPDVLHPHVEERIARLRRHLQVELVAEIRRVRGQDAVAEEAEDRRVLALERELELGLELVEIVEMAHRLSVALQGGRSRVRGPESRARGRGRGAARAR